MKKRNQKTSRRKKADNSLFSYYSFSEEDAKKYPVVSRILKQLTPERIKKEIEAIQKTKLPPELQKLLKEYREILRLGRGDYVWKWLYGTSSIVVLPTIMEKYRKSLVSVKFLIFFLTGLLDDIADKYSLRNKKLLNELLKVPFIFDFIVFNGLTPEEKRYIKFTRKVFMDIENALKKYPRHREFRNIFEYDIEQLLNTIKYCYLINQNSYLINKTEYWLYLPHNMTVMINITIDLMCSSKFSVRDLSKLRKISWKIQKMMRIANCLGTWKREIYDGDFTSAVFSYAIDLGIITVSDLKTKDKLKIVRKIENSKIQRILLEEWERIYWKVEKIKFKKAIINNFKKISETLLFNHLSSGTTYDL